MSIFCPFCLSEHYNNTCKVKDNEIEIPEEYIDYTNNEGIPVYPITVVGYSTCGKTAYLTSLIESFFDSTLSEWMTHRWLNQESITDFLKNRDTIHKDKRFPSLSSNLSRIPLLAKISFSRNGLLRKKVEKNAILVIYDVEGESYNDIKSIKTKFPLIAQIPNLILLVDLFFIYKNEGSGTDLDVFLHTLVNQLINALKGLKAEPKSKNIVICFTKMDIECDIEKNSNTDNKHAFEELHLNQDESKLSGYDFEKNSNEGIIKMSKKIEDFIRKKWTSSYRIITDNFGGYLFVSSSNVGNPPVMERYSDFSIEDFTKKDISKENLFNAINDDKYPSINIDNIDSLNDLLKVSNFYDILSNKKPDKKFTNDIYVLVAKTIEYRNIESFTSLEIEQQNNIKELNRLLLEYTYPKLTPKSQIIPKIKEWKPTRVIDPLLWLLTI